jgi:hypothetical protein
VGTLSSLTDDELVALELESSIADVTGVVSCTCRATATRASWVVTILTGLPMDWHNKVLIQRADAAPTGSSPGWPRRASGATNVSVAGARARRAW